MNFEIEYKHYTSDGIYVHTPIRILSLIDTSSGFRRGVKTEVNSRLLFSLKKTEEYLREYWDKNKYRLDLPFNEIILLEI